jgi:hypothetical protein
MTPLLHFLSGPGLAVTLLIFAAGMGFRIVRGGCGNPFAFLRDRFRLRFRDGWPVAVLVNYAVLLLVLLGLVCVVFLMGHGEIIRGLLGFAPPSLPPFPADVLAFALTGAALFPALRALAVPELRGATTWRDCLRMALVAVPLLSGIGARMGAPAGVTLLHLVSGHIFLVLAPFCDWKRLVR